MKQILLLAAIYSLIINQSFKNVKVNPFPGEQKTRVTPDDSSIRFYQRYTARGNEGYNYMNAGFINNDSITIPVKRDEKSFY